MWSRYLVLQDGSDDSESDIASGKDRHEPESHDVPTSEYNRQKTPRESDGPAVEVFRISMHDSTKRVVPAATKKYNINGDCITHSL